jgi:NADPH:quinone reductase-like Zn-dependent oxidoreductase
VKVYEIPEGCTSLEGLRQAERAQPSCGPRQVLVKVRAASLNYRDQSVVIGQYFGGSVKRNTIPLSDGAGEVVSTGTGVTRFKAGDRVAATFFQTWVDGRRPPTAGALGSPLDGMLAEYVALDEDGLVRIPDHLSFEEAACLPCAAVTAWHALMEHRQLLPGESVLVLGTGGVSIFALQFARMAGANVYLTSSSDEKIECAKAMGATAGVNYRTTPEWQKEILALTGGNGVDHVIEVGGTGTFGRSVQTLAVGGELSLIGVLTQAKEDPNLGMLMVKNASARGIFVGNRRMFEDMNRAIATGKLKPVIDRVFPFDAAADAYRHELSGAHMGKVVISIQ